MSDDKEALARRAVKAWTGCGLGWMPGMLDDAGHRVTDPAGQRPSDLPNLDDHATLGCIEHGMLPAAWGERCIISVKRWTSSDGTVMADIHVHEFPGACPMLFGVVDVPLAEALVLCLEAAAERREP